MAARLCWLGLSDMGKAVCRKIVQQTSPPEPWILWNPQIKDAMDVHKIEANTVMADSLETAIVHSDIIWSSFSDEENALSVLKTVQKCDVAGKLFILCGKASKDVIDAFMSAIVGARGECVSVLFHGNPEDALAGKLTCSMSGEQASMDKVKKLLTGVVIEG